MTEGNATGRHGDQGRSVEESVHLCARRLIDLGFKVGGLILVESRGPGAPDVGVLMVAKQEMDMPRLAIGKRHELLDNRRGLIGIVVEIGVFPPCRQRRSVDNVTEEDPMRVPLVATTLQEKIAERAEVFAVSMDIGADQARPKARQVHTPSAFEITDHRSPTPFHLSKSPPSYPDVACCAHAKVTLCTNRTLRRTLMSRTRTRCAK